VMVLSDDDVHPYHYARILGIYHAMVSLGNQMPWKMDFLWVLWFGFDSEHCWGWKAKHLPRVVFLDSQYAFGFLDPALVFQAVHLLPVSHLGKTSDFLGHSIARWRNKKDKDWCRYDVVMFSDREMAVRFCPELGLGH
ncbi:hypothetical protein BT96DRAFT_761750, partial [Gymnopus androsaceus JB14]